MKTKLFYSPYKKTPAQGLSSIRIHIENSEALDIFGVNNENIDFFEKNLPLKIYQKGNQLIIQGNNKNIDILKSAINLTISEKKMNKNNKYKPIILISVAIAAKRENKKRYLSLSLSKNLKQKNKANIEKDIKIISLQL